MWAYVKDGSIVQTNNFQTNLIINNTNFPTKYANEWTPDQKKAYGVYEVEEVNRSNLKDGNYYMNNDGTLAYDSSGDKVTLTYGTATAKEIADTKWTQKEIDDGDAPAGADTDTVKDEGLKTKRKAEINNQCAGILAPSDWMYIKAGEEGVSMDSGWKTWRASVRTKCNSMQTQIDNAANVDALAALFTYTEQGDGSVTRPLGEFPVKE